MTAERTRRRVARLEAQHAPRLRVRVTYYLPDGHTLGDPPPAGELPEGVTHCEVRFVRPTHGP